MRFREEPVTPVYRHWMCEQIGCNGELLSTGEGITRLTTRWKHRCGKCGHEDWADATYPRWRAFLMANATGGAIWAAVFGLGGFIFGKALLQLHHALAPIVFAVALAGFFGCGYLIRRYEDRLTVLAEQALPGPLIAVLHAKKP